MGRVCYGPSLYGMTWEWAEFAMGRVCYGLRCPVTSQNIPDKSRYPIPITEDDRVGRIHNGPNWNFKCFVILKAKHHVCIYSFICFDVFFYIFDIDSLAVFLNHLYLIVSDSGWQKRTCCLFLSSNISWIGRVNWWLLWGLNIAIKGNGFLALSSIAAPIYLLHIPMCRKVPLLQYVYHGRKTTTQQQ